MGKKHNMLLCSNISSPYVYDFTGREEEDGFEQTTNSNCSEWWKREHLRCETAHGSPAQPAELFDSLYSATRLLRLRLWLAPVLVNVRRAATNMLL